MQGTSIRLEAKYYKTKISVDKPNIMQGTSIRLEAKYYKTHISADKPNIMQMLGLTNL